MRKKILAALAACLLTFPAAAQSELPPLHVDGNQLKDDQGNIVVLHGVMDTPSPYFNNYRWTTWAEGCSDSKISACVNYFNRLFTAITDSTNGAYCNLFRLHLDCCWTNDNSVSYPVDDRESGTGEADISHYSGTRLTRYMSLLYWKIALQAIRHGMYVIMRPPGVCPGTIYVGGSYQKYLIDVWDRVTKNANVKKYSGQISIELANEPVSVKNADGSESDNTLHDFFQPIVDKIRANGFEGIIWVPGSGWQMNYKPYAKVPITGDQIGYAVHDYVGWYGTSDSNHDHNAAIKNFGESIPIVRTNPIVITEVDWSPEKEGTGHYDEHGKWVVANYGTWATGTTRKWGLAYKAVLDYYKNISMTLSGTACYIDIDDYENNRKVTPAFKTAMEANGLDPYEGCGVACFEWYADYAKVNYASTERYQPKQVVPDNPFAITKEWFNPTILYENTCSYANPAATNPLNTLKLVKAGCAGWRFENEEGIDLTPYKYLVIETQKAASKNTRFYLYDTSNFWGDRYVADIASQKVVKIELSELKTESGRDLDLSHIRLAGFCSAGADQTFYLKRVFLSNDGVNPAETNPEVTLQDVVTLIGNYLKAESTVKMNEITKMIESLK